MTEFVEVFSPPGAAPEVGRALRRFALVCAAGEIASEMKITNWSRGEAWWAAAQCFQAWLSDRGGAGAFEADTAIAQVRAFLEQHGSSRFQ